MDRMSRQRVGEGSRKRQRNRGKTITKDINMKKHYTKLLNKRGTSFCACGMHTLNEHITPNKDEVTCKRCLKSLEPPKPKKCWIKLKGIDQSLDITSENRTIEQLISRVLELATYDQIEKEIERRMESSQNPVD